MTVHDFNTVVYIDSDGWFIAEDKYGGELAESQTAPETVLQTAFDRSGDVKIMIGDYNMSAGFAGLKLKSELVIHSNYNVKLKVPAGYTGGCLIARPSYNSGTLRNLDFVGGLTIQEQAPQSFLYSGFQFDGDTANQGLTFSEIGNMHIWHAKRMIDFNFATSGAWITTVKFKQMKAYYSEMILEVRNPLAQALGLSTCTFEYVGNQSSTNTAYGFKGLGGNNNLYQQCAVWDVQDSQVPGGVISAEFIAEATNQYVLAGIMTHSNYTNNAPKGQVRDMSAHSPIVPMWDVLKQLVTVTAPTDGSKSINLPHGMGLEPDWAIVFPKSKDACTSPFRVSSKNTTNVTITYEGAPPTASTTGNQNNLVYELWTSVR